MPLCDECIAAIQAIEGSLCALCGERLSYQQSLELSCELPPSHTDGAICDACRIEKPRYTRASAYGSYRAELRELIHLLKYEKLLPAAPVLGAKLALVIRAIQEQMKDPSLFDGPPILVIPVPLHPAKMRERGFNQAEMITRAALREIASPGLELNSRLLMRQRITEPQIGLTQNQRRENLRGAFALAKPEVVSGRQVLLVDDVLTTGTTASECARVLHRAGASEVWVATVARTLKRDGQRLENLEMPLAVAG